MRHHSPRQRLNDYRALLDLREHDLDRLLADNQSFLLNLLAILESGLVQVARNMIVHRLAERHGVEVAR